LKQLYLNSYLIQRVLDMNQLRVQQLIEKARAAQAARVTNTTNNISTTITNRETEKTITILNKYNEAVTLNKEQVYATELASKLQSFVLVGAAGTGKTTGTYGVIEKLGQNKSIPIIEADGHRYLKGGTPGIIGVAYTRNAVNNLKKSLPLSMHNNVLTIHKLLEYAPVFHEDVDSEGYLHTKRVFEPRRNASNPINPTVKVIIIEEASMVSLDLYKQLLDALQHKVMFIFIGDINQIPPIFGSSILGFACLNLPVVELTHVYRNAGPIIQLAHRILEGRPIPKSEWSKYEVPDVIRIQSWKKRLYPEDAVHLAAKRVIQLIEANYFDIEKDMLLCPYNKAFGTIELNKIIANHLTLQRGATTYEIVTGFSTMYLAVGDRVLLDKELGTIVSIKTNVGYTGKAPQKESKYLDRWGITNMPTESELVTYNTDAAKEDDLDTLLSGMTSISDETEDRKRQASHVVGVVLDRHDEEDEIIELTSAGEINNLLLGYSMTIHKAQGSEWRRVILALHRSHNTMLARELLYTAVTRARESLYTICEEDTFERGIVKQRITGDTLEEKAEFFKGKVIENEMGEIRYC